MKRSTFMLIASIYGFLLGAILVFAPSEAMKNYGYQTIDYLHTDLSVHVGGLVLILAAFLFLHRNSENEGIINLLLLMNCIASITGALYDIYSFKHAAIPMPASGYFDIGLRLIIGFAYIFYLKKKN
jgi:hypothetical protein